MKKVFLAGLGCACLALASSVSAQVTPTAYNDGDIMLGVRSSDGTRCYLLNLGPATLYTAGNSFPVNVGNILPDLNNVFGNDWYTRIDPNTATNAVVYAVVGTSRNGAIGDPNQTLYTSNPDDTAPFDRQPVAAQAQPATYIFSMGGFYAGNSSTANSPVGLIEQNNPTNSYRAFQPGGTRGFTISFAFFDPSNEVAPNGTAYFYRSTPGSGSQVQFGFFTISAAGAVQYTATATLTIPPNITSATSTVFNLGVNGQFQVTATGRPAPTFSATGPLPAGVTLSPAGLLGGTPAAGTGGSYPIVITASNGVAPTANQNFTLMVNRPPVPGANAFGTPQDQALNITTTRLLSNATDPDLDPLTFMGVVSPSAQGGSVVLNAGTITYTPLAAFVGNDSFTYTIADGRGGVASGTVSVTVTAAGQPSVVVVSLTVPSGSATAVSFQGIPGVTYIVQSSDDLVSAWTDRSTVIADNAGAFSFSDSIPLPPKRFYRVVAAP